MMNLGLTKRPDLVGVWRDAAAALMWSEDSTLRIVSLLLEKAADHIQGIKPMGFGDALLAFARDPETGLPFTPDLDATVQRGGDVGGLDWRYDHDSGVFWRVGPRGLVAISWQLLEEEINDRFGWCVQYDVDDWDQLEPTPADALDWLNTGCVPPAWSKQSVHIRWMPPPSERL
jgi:hypothetical protein